MVRRNDRADEEGDRAKELRVHPRTAGFGELSSRSRKEAMDMAADGRTEDEARARVRNNNEDRRY